MKLDFNKYMRCLGRSVFLALLIIGINCSMVFANVTPTPSPTPTPTPTPTSSASPSPSVTPRPSATMAQASSAPAISSRNMQDTKREGRKEISDYAEISKVGMSEAVKAQIDELANAYMDKIGTRNRLSNGSYEKDENGKYVIYGGLKSKDSIEECVTIAKNAIDALVQGKDSDEKTTPSSTSDFVMVGGNWMTPNVAYGQYVDIVLPVVNMGVANLNNVTVTPVISNTVNEWPFVVETSGYTQTISDLPGKGNGQSDMDRRRELTWTFKARDDAMSGYYKLQFNVIYYVGSEVENCTLTTYVKVRGAEGSGNIENEGAGISTPRVIVTGFRTEPEKVHAGDKFKLIVQLQNTSQRTAVSNMLVTFAAPSEGDLENSYAVFLPVAGSNSVYVDRIAKGGQREVSIELSAKNDLSQKPYQMDVNMEFEDDDYASFTASADVSIPIYQDARFELSKPEILPESINVGSEANVMFSIYNLGKVTLQNVHVNFEGDAVSGGDCFLGKVDAGGTGSVDAMVKGEAPTDEKNPVKVVITYENEAGEKFEYKQDIALIVSGSMDAGAGDGFDLYDEYYDEIDFEDEQESGNRIWIIVLVAVGIIVLIAGIVIAVKILKKRKEQKENMTLLSDLEDGEEGEDDEIS